MSVPEPTRGEITIEVLFFARTREIAGCPRTTLNLPEGADVALVRTVLAERFPALAVALASCRLAVQEAFGDDRTPVADGDTVAVLPPVSGG